MHLDEGRIQRLLDGELDAAAEHAMRTHAAACEECRARIDQARGNAMAASLLETLDVPAPRIDALAVAARARVEEPAPRFQMAAGFVLALALVGGAYVAWAAPGSPVRAWVDSVAEWLQARQHQGAPPPADGAGGIAVAPGARLTIVFATAQPAGTARVSLTDGDEVVIRAAHGAATFSSSADRLVVGNAGSTADFTVELPRAAPRIEILLGGRRLLLKDGASVTAVGAQTAEPYLLPLQSAAQ